MASPSTDLAAVSDTGEVPPGPEALPPPSDSEEAGAGAEDLRLHHPLSAALSAAATDGSEVNAHNDPARALAAVSPRSGTTHNEATNMWNVELDAVSGLAEDGSRPPGHRPMDARAAAIDVGSDVYHGGAEDEAHAADRQRRANAAEVRRNKRISAVINGPLPHPFEPGRASRVTARTLSTDSSASTERPLLNVPSGSAFAEESTPSTITQPGSLGLSHGSETEQPSGQFPPATLNRHRQNAAGKWSETVLPTATPRLRVGCFNVDRDDLERRKSVPFTYVPDGFMSSEGPAEELMEVLASVGISKLPHVAFEFNRCNLLAPASDDAAASREKLARVEQTLDSLSDQAQLTDSMYVLTRPFRGNILSELACKTARQGTDVLGLFCNLSVVAEKVTSGDAGERHSHSDRRYVSPPMRKPTAQSDGVVTYDHEIWDANRQCIPASAFLEATTPWSKVEPSQAQRRILVTSEYTRDEKRVLEGLGVQAIDGGLIKDVTHALVFETERQRARFQRMLFHHVSSCVVAAGGTDEMLDAAINCMQVDRPLIVLEGTGGAADFIASRVHDSRAKPDPQPPPAGDGAAGGGGVIGNLMSFISAPSSDNQQGADSPPGRRGNAKRRHPPKERYPEGMFDDIYQPDPSTSRCEDLAAKCKDAAKMPGFRPKGDQLPKGLAWTLPLLITQQHDLKHNQVERKIKRALADAYTEVANPQEQEVEMSALIAADRFRETLERSATRYQGTSRFLTWLVHVLLLASILCALLQAHFVETAAAAAIADPSTVAGSSDDALASLGRSTTLEVANVVLPFLSAFLASFRAWLRPVQKFAADFRAASRIKSEIFRYWTRTGKYRTPINSNRKVPRHVFTQAVQKIMKARSTADTQNGSNAWTRDSCWGMLTLGYCFMVNPVKSRSRALFPEGLLCRTGIHDLEHGRGHFGSSNILTGDQYFEVRVLAEIEAGKEWLTRYDERHVCIQFLAIMATFAAGLLASFRLELWVPLLVGFIALLEFVVAEYQLDTQLPNINLATDTLQLLAIHWRSLYTIEKYAPSNVDVLVDSVEKAVLIMNEAYAEQALENAKQEAELAAAQSAEAKQTSQSRARRRAANFVTQGAPGERGL